MPDSRVAIYALADPRTNKIRYVGKADDPAKRLLGHLRNCRQAKTHVQRWLAQLAALGLRPTLSILQAVDKSRWAEAERAWIAKGRAEGWPLTNYADGGQGGGAHKGKAHSAESRQKMSQAHKGEKRTLESVEKQAAQLRGRKRPAEVCAKISAGRKGKSNPAEAIARTAAKNTGRKQSAELVERRIGKLRGQKRPAETMAKMAKTRRALTDEQVARARQMEKQGITQRKIAEALGVAQSTIGRALRGTMYAYEAG